MPPLTAVVIGATGFIGELLVEQLLQDEAFGTVRLLLRRNIDKQHPKLQQAIVNFDDVNDVAEKMGTGDCVFCAVGTTQAKVKGDKDAYRKVDYDIPMNTARIAKQAGFQQYLLVSAIGTNPNGSNFYVRLKGEVERDITAVGIPSLHIFKPSMLLGQRKEFRLGEWIGKGLMQAISFVFVGSLKKWKGIHGNDVAKAMVQVAKHRNERGVFYYDYRAMLKLISE